MKITIICVGKIKEKFYTEAVREYSKRLSRYCTLSITEVADEKTKEQASETEIDMVKDREGERILKYIRPDGYVIALAIDGKQPDSIELSREIEKLKEVFYYEAFCNTIYLSSGVLPGGNGCVPPDRNDQVPLPFKCCRYVESAVREHY